MDFNINQMEKGSNLKSLNQGFFHGSNNFFIGSLNFQFSNVY